MESYYSPPSPYSGAQVTNGISPAPFAQLSPPPPQNPSYPLPPPLQHPNHVTLPIGISSFGPFPVQLNCPYCHNHITTQTSRSAGALPWIVFSVCFISGLILFIPWFFCWIPFCIDSWMDIKHTCPSCQRDVGRFSRI